MILPTHGTHLSNIPMIVLHETKRVTIHIPVSLFPLSRPDNHVCTFAPGCGCVPAPTYAWVRLSVRPHSRIRQRTHTRLPACLHARPHAKAIQGPNCQNSFAGSGLAGGLKMGFGKSQRCHLPKSGGPCQRFRRLGLGHSPKTFSASLPAVFLCQIPFSVYPTKICISCLPNKKRRWILSAPQPYSRIELASLACCGCHRGLFLFRK